MPLSLFGGQGQLCGVCSLLPPLCGFQGFELRLLDLQAKYLMYWGVSPALLFLFSSGAYWIFLDCICDLSVSAVLCLWNSIIVVFASCISRHAELGTGGGGRAGAQIYPKNRWEPQWSPLMRTQASEGSGALGDSALDSTFLHAGWDRNNLLWSVQPFVLPNQTANTAVTPV